MEKLTVVLAIICGVLQLGTAQILRGYSPMNPCDSGSCYPSTGNLLIGRTNALTASSTCGLENEERYCVMSNDQRKCYRCDSRPQFANSPVLNHKIGNVVSRLYDGTQQRSWWQSANGVEDVTIQLDLEAQFHFTHLIMSFKSARPAAMFIEKSSDFGATWRVHRYFADNCTRRFPEVEMGPETSLTQVICEEGQSSANPPTEGEVIFRTLPKSVQITDPYSPEVQMLLKATNIRIRFVKNHNHETDLETDHYALYEIVFRGSCSCNGHASRCLPMNLDADSPPDMVHGRCECQHNTKGINCQECDDIYNDLPWMPALFRQTNACKRCDCNYHAATCSFSNERYEASGRMSGGECNCAHNTDGNKCQFCKADAYRVTDKDVRDPDTCQLCECDEEGSLNEGCDDETGQCRCRDGYSGRDCSTAPQNENPAKRNFLYKFFHTVAWW